MEYLISILNNLFQSNKEKSCQVEALISEIYVKYLSRCFPRFRLFKSEEKAILNDLLKLMDRINKDQSFKGFKCKSKKISRFFNLYKDDDDNDITVEVIKSQVIEPNSYFITTFLIIKLFYRTRTINFFTWLVSTITAIIAALGTYTIIINFL